MGIDFAQNSLAEELQRTNTPNDILNLLQQRENAFLHYRNRNRTFIDCFSPAVRVLHIFSEKLGDMVNLVSFAALFLFSFRCDQFDSTPIALPSCKGYLCRNRCSPHCTSIYDALLDLFECLGNFLKRLDIYINIPPTEMMTDIIVKIMVELLSVLVLAKKQIKRGRLSTCNLKYYSSWLSVQQRRTQGRFSETIRSRVCLSGWID
jgi:hypothetical protein